MDPALVTPEHNDHHSLMVLLTATIDNLMVAGFSSKALPQNMLQEDIASLKVELLAQRRLLETCLKTLQPVRPSLGLGNRFEIQNRLIGRSSNSIIDSKSILFSSIYNFLIRAFLLLLWKQKLMRVISFHSIMKKILKEGEERKWK